MVNPRLPRTPPRQGAHERDFTQPSWLSLARRVSAGTTAHAADDACWARAKGWALVLGLVCLAHSADNPLIAEIGQRTIAAVLA